MPGLPALALALAGLALAACGRAADGPPAGSEAELAAYLGRVAAGAPDAIDRELAHWPLDRALWERTVVPVYRPLWGELAPAPALAKLRAALRPGAVAVRRHFSDDPRLTPGQRWQRWALPVLYRSFVAEIDGRPLDAVFLHDGARWRTLAGLPELIEGRVRALDAACAPVLQGVGAKACADLAWAVADAALRSQSDAFARYCRSAASLCGTRSP